MQIWVDADACPAVIREILYRVAERVALPVTLVANQLLRVPPSRFVRALQVPAGADVADQEIVRRLAPGDLVVTGDIPLAAAVLDKGGFALNPRGEFYTDQNIAQMLSMRAFMEELRGSGVDTGGPPPFSQADRQQFANSLDRHLRKVLPVASVVPAQAGTDGVPPQSDYS
ncbi:MAG: YaiI/YqxD family protein [Sphingomonadaceae bacterium]